MWVSAKKMALEGCQLLPGGVSLVMVVPDCHDLSEMYEKSER